MAKAQKPESPPIIKDNFSQLSDKINLKGQEIIKFISNIWGSIPSFDLNYSKGKFFIGFLRNAAISILI